MTDLLIIQAGAAPSDLQYDFGDIASWFLRTLDKTGKQLEVIRVFEGQVLPPPSSQRVAIITGSWSMVTDRLPWSERLAEWIREAMVIEMPLFGVCYGHQLMAHALGGRVDYHPDGLELGCKKVRLLDSAVEDPLLQGLPCEFVANLTHRQTILKLPEGAITLAANDHDRHQIVRYGRRAISTQFHPEFTPALMEACIKRQAQALTELGADIGHLLGGICHAPEAEQLLVRFVETVS